MTNSDRGLLAALRPKERQRRCVDTPVEKGGGIDESTLNMLGYRSRRGFRNRTIPLLNSPRLISDGMRRRCRGTVDRPTSSAYNTVADRSSPVSFVARNFLEAVALVLCVAGLATVLYQLLRQSLVVGYLVAGLELHRACWSLQESRIVS